MARRAQIVLLASEGVENKEIAVRLGARPNTAGTWRRRFAEQRLDGLHDEPRPGAPRQIGDEEIAETIRLTLETTPRDAIHCSLRSMARAVGRWSCALYDPPHLDSLWPSATPHRKLQTVIRCAVCGEGARHRRALSRAARAGAGSVRGREESQIQALDRTQPCLQMRSWPDRAAQPRLHAAWDPLPFRRARCR
nr:helix-turn-helix domain-containing protein [Mesorhizobium sp.]